MSMQVIGELFEQIVNSEEKIKKRFETLRKVNQEIQQFQEKIRITNIENENILSNITLTDHKVIQEQVELKWLEAREKILNDQKLQSVKENEALKKELEDLNTQHDQERDNFMKNCDDFLNKYDVLENKMMEEHTEKMKTRIDVLQKELDEISQSIYQVKCEKEKYLKMEEKKKNVDSEIKIEFSQRNDLQKLLKDLKKERKHLITSKDNLMKNFTNDPEITRLNRELEENKSMFVQMRQQHQVLAKQICDNKYNNQNRESRSKRFSTTNENPWKVSSNQTIPMKRTALIPNNENLIMESAFTTAASRLNKQTLPRQQKRFRYEPSRRKENKSSGVDDLESCFSEEIETESFDFGLDEDMI